MWNTDLPTAQYIGHPYATLPTRPITHPDEIQRVIREVYNTREVAIDTETTGLIRWKDVPLYWSLAWGKQRATLHADLLPLFTPCFQNPNITWILANAKYDMHILANFGHTLVGKWYCVQVMHSLLYDQLSHKLKFIAKHLLNWTWADFQDQFGRINAKQSPAQLIEKAERENFGLLVEYAANDAWGTLKVFEALRAKLQSERTYSLFIRKPPYIETLWDYFTKVASPFTRSLWKMERRGIKVNRAQFAAARPEAEKKIAEIEREITMRAGFALNPNSSIQVGKYMDSTGLTPLKWTSGGKSGIRRPSWDADSLEHYRHDDPVVGLIIQKREYEKLHGTYIVGLDALVDTYDRIHSSFNQTPRTGRISSSDPNLQNIPRPENDQWNLRKAFITDPGYTVIGFDYSQLEMRLLAAAAQEQTMVGVFLRGWDIHAGNASLMFGKSYDDINEAKGLLKKIAKLSPTDAAQEAETVLPGVLTRATLYGSTLEEYLHACAEDRTGAKSIGFGLNYGMGPNKLANDLGITVQAAKDKIAKYKGTYPAVERFMTETVEEGRASGFAFTILGRRRNIPMIMSSNKVERAQGERLAVNTVIQGSAADITMMAQLSIDTLALDREYDCHTVLQVHDELVFECRTEYVPFAMSNIQEIMEHPFSEELLCPLVAEGGSGDSWGEAKG
jgi:DNA polymerase-1